MVWIWIAVALAALLTVLIIRTVRFRPGDVYTGNTDSVTFDRDRAVDSLAKLVRCKTVSRETHEEEDEAEFSNLVGMLPELYPLVSQNCSLLKFEDRGLLYCWKGKKQGEPAILMAHYDVVPVEEENWTHPAFDAEIVDDIMWGRGTLDTKITFNGILSAAEALMEQGFQPEYDVYFAFSGGEEVNGKGAEHIVAWFKRQSITPAMVLDEGGAVVKNVFPGVKEPCGLIGIAEKGMLNLEYTVSSDGGHASAPKPHTPVGELSAACCAVENHPFPSHFTKPVLEMFDTLGRHSTFLYRMIFANLWLFKGVLSLICKKQGGELNALIRTTVAFTQTSGSQAPNVIPPKATMVSNVRLNPMDSVDSAVKDIKRKIRNKNVNLQVFNHHEPSPISRTDVQGWFTVRNAVANTWKGCLVSPYLMVQCSDSRHYRDLSDRVYRFSACDLTAEERHSIHGNDEHVRLETVCKAVEFFIRVMREC